MTVTGKLLAAFILLNCVLAGYWFVCRDKYGEVSGAAYDFASAVYSTCNRQDVARLPKLAELVGSARSEAKITADEADVLAGIITIAEAGNWAAATTEARRLMEEQVRIP